MAISELGSQRQEGSPSEPRRPGSLLSAWIKTLLLRQHWLEGKTVGIAAVILDLDGTLLDSREDPVPGVKDMLSSLRSNGIQIAIASNRPNVTARVRSAGLVHDLIMGQDTVGAKKGSPRWVESACTDFGIPTNQVVWLGDSDLDMRSAANAHIVYFNAGWSVPDYLYGINVPSPRVFDLVITECFTKTLYWYWQLSEVDGAGRSLEVKAMIDGNGAGIPALKDDLIRFLKYGGDPSVGPLSVRDFMMIHLLASIYGEGLASSVDTWTTYPGSRGGSNAAMAPFIHMAARLFRDKYVDDLLVRHQPAIDSGKSRWQRRGVNFLNQVNTVFLNNGHEQRVVDRRILVVDDFSTDGYSFECARNLLLEGGASDVVCVALGKYGLRHHIVSPRPGYSWDPFRPWRHNADAFNEFQQSGTTDNVALDVIRQSYVNVDTS